MTSNADDSLNSGSEGNKFSWNDFEVSIESQINFRKLKCCLDKRHKYQRDSLQDECVDSDYVMYNGYKYDSGVFRLLKDNEYVILCPTYEDFLVDSEYVINVCNDLPMKSLCFRRLENLKHNFLMYKNLCTDRERVEQKRNSRKDFYTVVKVDTHIHHSAAMNSKHLLNFIKSKLVSDSDSVVYERDGQELTLKQVFMSLGITSDYLCIDSLDTHAQTDTFHRFDRFNAKYNPYGQPELREIFLKYDNYNGGKFLAELTSQLMESYAESKYIYAEYRISVYGRDPLEWKRLARWAHVHQVRSKHVRWLIQVPRLYNVLYEGGCVSSFGQMLQNIFEPLFAVTFEPESDRMLADFLEDVVGFDCVDDESLKEKRILKLFSVPCEWRYKMNPGYFVYMYYLYANIAMLNHARRGLKKRVFHFRPHSGETGDYEHLVYAFLVSKSISHGVQLRKSYPLQYLYYLSQVGIAMSPLSNNSLFLKIESSPFPHFFKCGLNVSLSTDDPLQFHFTKEPLMEEYSVCSQIWRLNSADQCELARNSVLQSSFDASSKYEWLGHSLQDKFANNIQFTNVPNIRIQFRKNMYLQEIDLINSCVDE